MSGGFGVILRGRAACWAVVLAALVAGCGERASEVAKSETPPTPEFVDPGTDLFVWDDVDVATGASPKAESAVRTVLRDAAPSAPAGKLTVDYPLEGSLFPPELCPPTFLWHDANDAVNAWLIDVAFEGHANHVYVVTSGVRRQREIDPRCVTDTNVWTEPAYEASAKAWTPDPRTWSIVKQRSVERKATVTVHGLVGTNAAAGTRTIVSRGAVTITTSKDPVGAQVFYRDVPLMPAQTEEGVIKPLRDSALPLIQWRLRDLSKPEAPVVMQHLPTCANCHTFSPDGRTLSMDMDGPSGDKGAHAVKTVSRRMVIEKDDVFSWNSFSKRGAGKQSYGLFPQVSPDGRYVVATIHEELYVTNYLQYEFLQTFYPTRGVLAVYSRDTGEIGTLPGADDERYVQSNATWSPDGTELVFIRAEAQPAYVAGPQAKSANDPNERQVRYDLYRIPFNGGKGGTPAAVTGASNDGMSRSFPRFTPDGKWIVFVGCRNGMLMRPDGKLYIIPAAGGEARLMRCNTPRMNSYHSFSPNGRWMVFASKWPSPYTQMYLTHIDEDGNDTPAVLVPNSTAANRAANLPEFAAIAPGALEDITTPAVDYRRHLDRAREMEKQKNYVEAMTEVRRSLALKSDYPDTYLALGFLLELEGKAEEGMAAYRKALVIDPRFHPAFNSIGAAFMRMGRLDEAVENYQHALRIYPFYDKALVNLADALNRQRKPREAVTYLERALARDPENALAHHNLGVSFLFMNRPREAVDHFRKAIAINPDDAYSHNNLAATLVDLGQTAEAVEHYRAAIRIDPDYTPTCDALAWLLATSRDAAVRDGAEALRLARLACTRTRSENPAFLLTLSAAEAETGAFDGAVRTAERALALARTQHDDRLAAVVARHLETLKQRKPLRQ